MDQALAHRIIEARERVAANFNGGHWEELGLLTGATDIIDGHSRLLRSLSFGDSDYEGNALSVLRSIVERDPSAITSIEAYLDKKFPGESHFISAKPAERKITFAPHVFQVPDALVQPDLVAIMMPFAKSFDPVSASIKAACDVNGLRGQRVDDIWEESAIIQDVFNLIFRANVIVVDFTGKNANVMYETGIAHTLGKHVIPLTQSLADIPFDMQHHRALHYLPNGEGILVLQKALTAKLKQFAGPPSRAVASTPPVSDDDDVPF